MKFRIVNLKWALNVSWQSHCISLCYAMLFYSLFHSWIDDYVIYFSLFSKLQYTLPGFPTQLIHYGKQKASDGNFSGHHHQVCQHIVLSPLSTDKLSLLLVKQRLILPPVHRLGEASHSPRWLWLLSRYKSKAE